VKPRQERIYNGELKRGFASLTNTSPSLNKGGGYRGWVVKPQGGEVENYRGDKGGRLLLIKKEVLRGHCSPPHLPGHRIPFKSPLKPPDFDYSASPIQLEASCEYTSWTKISPATL
jgi:hypothetical protein